MSDFRPSDRANLESNTTEGSDMTDKIERWKPREAYSVDPVLLALVGNHDGQCHALDAGREQLHLDEVEMRPSLADIDLPDALRAEPVLLPQVPERSVTSDAVHQDLFVLVFSTERHRSVADTGRVDVVYQDRCIYRCRNVAADERRAAGR
jgi:hypothetical protein